MDLDTFITTLYVFIDDWYKQEIGEKLNRRFGPAPKLSDSEVLTIAVAGQWRCGVPWQSERGLVRFMQAHGLGWFPKMLKRSRFNERVRHLWSALVSLQQYLAQVLGSNQTNYEVVDCVPLPSCSNAQALRKGHWLWWGMRGTGGTSSTWYWGDQVIMSVTSDHVITGWQIGAANIDDRVMLQALISARHGDDVHIFPKPYRPFRALSAPSFILPKLAAGTINSSRCYLADKGFNGQRWQNHWYEIYQISVLTETQRRYPPKHWNASWGKWFRGMRQAIETTFAILIEVFTLKRLNAHSRGGQIARFAAITAAYNWGIYLNRNIARSDLTHATIIC